MEPPKNGRLGRPKTNPPPRREQVRLAKRAQRAREREAGVTVVPIKLSACDAGRLRVAMTDPEFMLRLRALLDDETIEIVAYENLKALCWNRRDRYLRAEEAFRLYERNRRLVDRRRMVAAERALIKRLAARYGLSVGLKRATEAYGKVVARDAKRAATKMAERDPWRRH